MQDLIDEYILELKNDNDFIELKKLKKIIDEKYFKEIMSFKTKESIYNDAIKNGSYYNDIDSIRNDFINAKANLYKKEEVKEYFRLEKIIQNKLNNDLNIIKDSLGIDNNKKCIKH